MLENLHDLLPIAYRAAARVVRNPVMAEEASERALHLLTLAMLHGCAPQRPEAWLKVVARRSACALLRSNWARTHAVENDELMACQAPYHRPKPEGASCVREHLAGRLSPRQQAALDAALCCNGTRAAARRCGMQPRDFRRSLGEVSRKARRLLQDEVPPSLYDDDPAVQFGLST
jgi:DNA-directed RNA polymerase specialized sigma24 family protein